MILACFEAAGVAHWCVILWKMGIGVGVGDEALVLFHVFTVLQFLLCPFHTKTSLFQNVLIESTQDPLLYPLRH